MAELNLIQIFVSLDILKEISRVLECERILTILKRSRMEPSSIMATILSLSSIVDVHVKVRTIEVDPSDTKILACAKQASAQFIVSGDHHLLRLGHYEGISILTASRFLEMQKASKRTDSADAFLVRKPTGRSGRKDLARSHDRYLYGKGDAKRIEREERKKAAQDLFEDIRTRKHVAPRGFINQTIQEARKNR